VRVVSTHGAIEIEDLEIGNTQKVNGQRPKPFLELEIPEIEVLPLEDRLHLIDHMLWRV
jgi:hypothetical protein